MATDQRVEYQTQRFLCRSVRGYLSVRNNQRSTIVKCRAKRGQKMTEKDGNGPACLVRFINNM
jgi:hypothetical protein